MDLTLTIAILGAVVTGLGWVISYIFTTVADRQRQNLISQLDFTTQQLEELYGPLAFLLLEGRQTFRDLLASLGRNFVFLNDGQKDLPLPANELKIWLFWIENDFFPRDQKIQELLSSKIHLIEGEKIPESFLLFLDHYNSWKINHERWKQQGVEYSWRSKVAWPEAFEEDVISTLRLLKKQHLKLLGRVHKR